MAAYIGSTGEYRDGKEEWLQHTKHLNHFLSASGIEDEKKNGVFYGDQTANL